MHNFNETDIIEYENFFSEEDFQKILQYTKKPNWEFGHTSYSQESPHYQSCIPFWKMELSEEKFFNEHLLNIINQKINIKSKAYNVYMNGQTYGQHGFPHVDAHEDNYRTFLLYAVPNWDPFLGGKTAYIINDKKSHYVTPGRNKAVYFPGVIPHFSEELNRIFSALRVTVAWKLILE